MESVVSEYKGKALTTKVIIIGIMLVAITAFFNQSEYIDFYETVGMLTHLDSAFMLFPGAMHTTVLGGTFLGLIIVSLIALIDRKHLFFTKQELAMLFIIAVFITSINLSKDGFLSGEDFHEYMLPFSWVYDTSASRQENFLAAYGGTVWCPGEFTNKDYVLQVLRGSLLKGDMMPINWGYWLPLLSYRVLSLTALTFMGVSIALLTRRSFIEIESLAFPWAEINMVAFDQTISFIEERKVSKPLLLSFLVFFIFFFSMYGPNNVMWLLRVPGVSFKTWMPWWTYPPINPTVGSLQWWTSGNLFEQDLSLLGLSFLPWIPILIHLWPVNHAAFFIMPMDILIGCFVGDIFFEWIYPQIMSFMGYLGSWKAQESVYGVGRSVPNAWSGSGVFFGFGLFLPLIVIPLVKNRSIFGPIFKSITGSKVRKEIDPNQPTSYFSAWLLALVSIIMLIISFQIVGWPVIWTLPVVLLFFAVAIGQLRVIAVGAAFIFATCGFANFDPNQIFGQLNAVLRYITLWLLQLTGIDNTKYDPSSNTWAAFWGGFTGYGGAAGFRMWWLIMGAAACLLGFFIAHRVKIEGKEVLKAALIFTPLSIVAFEVWHIVSIYINDVDSGLFFSKSLMGKVINRAFVRALNGIGFNWPTTIDPWIGRFTWMAIGMVITTVLYILRDRYAWFRIAPEGFWFGVVMGPTWTISLTMLIIKYLCTRVGGAKFYEGIAKPIAIGIVIAFGANVFIQHWLQLAYKWQTAFGINYPP